MSWYVTDNLTVANALLDLLNTEVMTALNSKVYMVEEVDIFFTGKKWKVSTENDAFKAWVRIMTSSRISTKYADLTTHKDGGLYAIPIVKLTYYDVDAKVKEQALLYGYIVSDLSSDWFPTEP
ncbi:MAG: hypothetical protein ACXABY_07090 [Candidatus Thorarchaeota archaeon]